MRSAWSATCSATPSRTVVIGSDVEAVFEHHADADPPFTLVHWSRV